MTPAEVQVTRQGPVTLITIDRQQARNAVDRVTAL
jgi:enoyl-CoA hydratase/carnithine racemase